MSSCPRTGDAPVTCQATSANTASDSIARVAGAMEAMPGVDAPEGHGSPHARSPAVDEDSAIAVPAAPAIAPPLIRMGAIPRARGTPIGGNTIAPIASIRPLPTAPAAAPRSAPFASRSPDEGFSDLGSDVPPEALVDETVAASGVTDVAGPGIAQPESAPAQQSMASDAISRCLVPGERHTSARSTRALSLSRRSLVGLERRKRPGKQVQYRMRSGARGAAPPSGYANENRLPRPE
jgi:hypothetical protein